ncbi:hypothetical protein NDU88_001282 [Pleurodeles waltl]|uniref:Uncharacterized protein n=1 Tax=Pleurodeles waltl TaxID=8319 RepID=A0AAV7R9A7_PLEWA|nr:hypothetical protein NDU88_001282 [Pleurodeles waltl]
MQRSCALRAHLQHPLPWDGLGCPHEPSAGLIRAPVMGRGADTAAHVTFTAQERASPVALILASLMPPEYRRNLSTSC